VTPEPTVTPLDEVPRTRSGEVDLDAIAAALAPADVLETAPAHEGWSYVVPHLGDRLTDDGERSRWTMATGTVIDAGRDPFAAIDRWCEDHHITPHVATDPSLPPFSGGLVGAFAYDLARRIERLPAVARVDRDQMHLSLRVAEVVVAVAPGRGQAVVCGRPLTSTGGVVAAQIAATTARVAGAIGRRTWRDPGHSTRTPITTSLPAADYLAAVEAVLAHIAAGDSFQVNLAQRLTAWTDTPLDVLYRRFRAASPAPYAACLPDVGVASVSPETFLAVTEGHATVRPVKGTRPRDDDPILDAAHADDLVTSAKDRAENVMVVDLERNDLGRVCVPGSVRVPRLCELEGHPTVWHLVSDVVGRLRPEVGYGQLLRATFPCGSITGAPKVRSMAIIESLERVRRGWYCGAVGFLGPGAASLSVAIRTATRHPGGRVDHGAGGGIVADSSPDAELAESLDKAAAFLRAVDGELVSAPVP
jgi:para-aminobenzoate synthetase component I